MLNNADPYENKKKLSHANLAGKDRVGTSLKKVSIMSENETEFHYMEPVENNKAKMTAQINFKQNPKKILHNQTFDNTYKSTETVNYKIGQNDEERTLVENRRSSLTYNQKF